MLLNLYGTVAIKQKQELKSKSTELPDRFHFIIFIYIHFTLFISLYSFLYIHFIILLNPFYYIDFIIFIYFFIPTEGIQRLSQVFPRLADFPNQGLETSRLRRAG